MSQKKELIIPTNIATLKVVEPEDGATTIEVNPDLQLTQKKDSFELMHAEIAYITGIPEDEEREVYESNDAHLSANMDPTQIAEALGTKYGIEVQWRRGIVPIFKKEEDDTTGEIRPAKNGLLISYNVSEISEEEKPQLLGPRELKGEGDDSKALVPHTTTLELLKKKNPTVVRKVRVAAFGFDRKNKLPDAA